ncbi:hypothetical protein H1R17_04015 [Flavobacterium sp. xlx-214]|uniref:hypothetical protein n=1 Tax=unclassified Flavobacterium TaxID=196869 RepID=UPI0013D5EA39|nr:MULTISPECIES: hypothetical protein [unclassified Flavobacterium]MBA5792058.1 hypothetical protein [Flavobacterium sp. xlx-221]QMI84307.1 hypothetical protein H1R17_04015 [Flavobacterium sp. xlx-214]
MKKLLLTAAIAFAVLTSTETFAQQGFGTNTPDKSAAVDIVSSKRGLLIPRIDIPNLNAAAPVTAPATSLFVYNTNATTGEGFYYWDGAKWVRFVSTNTEKEVVVAPGDNVKVTEVEVGNTTTYTVGVKEGTQGQVMVTVLNPTTNKLESKWVNPVDFIEGVNGITVTPVTDPATGITTNEVSLGGPLTKATDITVDPATGKTLSIKGLETLTTVTNEKVMVMDNNGVLKQVSVSDLLKAKDLTLEKELEFTNGTIGTGAVLVDTKIGVKNRSIGADKLDPGAATPGQIATVVNNGTTTEVKYQDASTAIGKTLSTDDIIGVGADAGSATASTLAGAVLTPTYLKIKDNSITATQIGTGAVGANELATGAVTADKLSTKNSENGTLAAANTVPVANADGTVTYKTIAAAAGEDLTTDGKIVIGATGNAQSLTDAVLVPTHLRIAPESITSADIKDGTITTTDIQAPNSTTNTGGTANQVMVTDDKGNVTWVNQSDLPSNTVMANGTNTTVSGNGSTATPFKVDVNIGNATTTGAVKQAAAGTEEVTIAADGTLSINETNVKLEGDVTGPLNATKVTAIQGTGVSTTAPTAANNMLVYNDGTKQWEPSTVAAAAGKNLTTDDVIQITGTGATTTSSATQSVLKDIKLEIGADKITAAHIAPDAVGASELADNAVDNTSIAPGAVSSDKMTSFTTANGTATPVASGMVPTADGKGGVTYQTVNSAVKVINGLHKDTTSEEIKLGGDLIEPTAINTNAANTLAITGLTNVAPTTATKNKVIVAETTGGILRTVDKVVTGTNVDVAANANYSFHTPEVVINVTLTNADQTITFPNASEAEGQVINIRIANTTDTHTGYLNVLTTYGSMPYQSWVVKSNGTAWEIVARN